MIGWITRRLLAEVKTSAAGLAGRYASSTAVYKTLVGVL